MNPSLAAVLLLTVQSVSPHPAIGVLTVRDAAVAQSVARVAGVADLWPVIRAERAAVIDTASGAIVYGKRPAAVAPIASVTKLVTALAVLEESLPGDRLVEVIVDDIPAEGHTMLRPGDRVAVDDLLTALLVASDNAAAHALARAVAGSREAFVERMQATTRRLNLRTVEVRDPAGLDSRNVGSAIDVARLVAVASGNEAIVWRTLLPTATIDGHRPGRETIVIRATNVIVRDRLRMSFRLRTAKTGYLDESGYNLAFVATRGGRAVAVAVLGAPTHDDRFRDARVLAAWALSL